jgi:hypothetical protein
VTWVTKLFGGGQPVPAAPLSGLQAVTQAFISSAMADRTQHSLRSAGSTGNEGMVLWSGIQDGMTFEITNVIVPPQRGIRSAEGVCVVIDGDALHQLNVETYKRGERLFAQVHTHPGRAYHSEMDDRYAVVTAPGGLSLVVPDFAVREFEVSECAIYRLSSAGRWEKVGKRDASALVRIREGPQR